tara:strand:+ start:2624 stop:3424 length:801 start_codon:yes stop_codon:yes gene_type:complete
MTKIGVVHYNWPGYSLEEFAQRANEIGYSYTELQFSDVWEQDFKDGERAATNIREKLAGNGICISAIQAGNNFLQADKTAQEIEIERYRSVCELTHYLGTDIVRSDGGWTRDIPEDLWDGMMLEAFKRCADFAEKAGVRIALDNHGFSTNDGEWQVSLIERVGSDRLGVNLDTMNYRWAGHDIDRCSHFYELVAPHVFHMHIKDGTGTHDNYQGTTLGEGEINLGHAVDCVKKAGYDGVWSVEYEGTDTENAMGFEQCFKWMKANV